MKGKARLVERKCEHFGTLNVPTPDEVWCSLSGNSEVLHDKRVVPANIWQRGHAGGQNNY